jgi:glycosyltransferase involved in cell wall biosynthesis
MGLTSFADPAILSRPMTTEADRPDVSVVLSTYNRAHVLPRALDSLLDQDHDHARYEVIAVDNNSTDGTREHIESFSTRASNLRYVFEAKQGLSHARNAGILAARAPLIAFTDDDVRVSRHWVSTIARLFAEHPEAACVGGKVLPNWSGPWPGWLTREHWSPLALLDYGDVPFYVNATRRLCLIGANCAYRREVFEQIGMFAPYVQTLGREAGTEDHELLVRLWRAGGQGLYWPRLTIVSDIAPERMQRRYHRPWHRRAGRFAALMRDEDFEQTRVGRLLGVPAHLYRQAAIDLVACVGRLLRGDLARAFTHEVGLWFFLGFLTARWRESFSRRGGPGTTTAA